jgi:DNA-binding transcriptional MerR regulator
VDRQLYRAGEFARKASVTIRTLRFYDTEGLLAPSQLSQAGYRLYSDDDLADLQQILALKFLGFSLEEIKRLRAVGPQRLSDVLAQQKAMLHEKRAQLAKVIEAIEENERLLQSSEWDWDSLVQVIQAMQMDQNNDWVKKYFTPEQQQQMNNLSQASYSEEARNALAARGPWTEEDQKKADTQWEAVGAELKRLTAANADPAGAEAQALAKQYQALISAFTGGNAAVNEGLKNWWKGYAEMPASQRPFQMPWGEAEGKFLDKVLAASR